MEVYLRNTQCLFVRGRALSRLESFQRTWFLIIVVDSQVALSLTDTAQGVPLTYQVGTQGHMETVTLSTRAHGITSLGCSSG